MFEQPKCISNGTLPKVQIILTFKKVGFHQTVILQLWCTLGFTLGYIMLSPSLVPNVLRMIIGPFQRFVPLKYLKVIIR